MSARDERLSAVRSFALSSLRVEQDRWQELEEGQQVVLSSFFNTPDYTHLFLCRGPGGVLSASLDFPQRVSSKVVCVSKAGPPEPVTGLTARPALAIQEVQGGNAKSFIMAACAEVTCPSLSNPETSSSVPEAAARLMARQRYEALLLKAQVEGRTCLAYPDGLHDDAGGRKWPDMKLLHACDSAVLEWAGLVSALLQQASGPLPSGEFLFWGRRLRNLHFLQQQLASGRAQQVSSVLQSAQSVYLSTLRDIHMHLQQALDEAEDVTLNLSPVQEKLEELDRMEYQQLGAQVCSVLQEVKLLWIRSEFYCQPSRVVLLLQETCSLFIRRSRTFLQGKDLLRGLVSEPSLGLEDVRQVVWTLQSLKEAYRQCRTQLEQNQDGDTHSWDFPSHLVFFRLDNFLLHLQSIEEVFCVSLQLHQLDSRPVSGVGGRRWTQQVQEVHQDFLCHVGVLSDCSCDPTDPDDQSLQLHLDQFWVQVLDLERRLVSVLSRAFDACCVSSSGAKLVKMFRCILDRPLIQDQLRPHLVRLEQLVLEELDQTELLVCSQRENTSSRSSPSAAAGLCWTRQLRLRAEDSLNHYATVQQLFLDSGAPQLVLQKFQQIVSLLQDVRDQLRSGWSSLLDSDCEFILEQPLIQDLQQGMLGVNCSHELQAVLRALRYVSREPAVELRPHAARLFSCRDDVTRSHRSLARMASCCQQVERGGLPVERPLIQDQLRDLNQDLSELQRYTWSSEGVQQLLQPMRERLLLFHSSVIQARSNMAAMTRIIQGWGAELHLLQHSGDSVLGGGATEQGYTRIREEGQELLRLTQVNRTLYGADDSSESWIRYLDHIDDRVQDGLFQLALRSLNLLVESMNPKSCSVILQVRLQLQETGSVFEPAVGVGLSDLLQTIISDVYAAAGLPPRISGSRRGSYQVSLQQSPVLSALEQEVMDHLLQVREEAELLLARLDRYSHLWLSDRKEVMQEFLTYSRQLRPEEVEVEVAPPTLKDFQREVESLHRLSREVTELRDVIVLHSWLQVDLRPFKDSLLSLIQDWRHMYTKYLLDSVSDSLQQFSHGDEDEDSSSSSLSDTILLLEAAGVELPEHLSARLQC